MRRLVAGSFGLLLVFGLAALSVVSIGCGGGGGNTTSVVLPTPTPVPTKSVVTVSVDTNPIIATPSGDSTYPWQIDYNVTVAETAGLACNINRVIASYRDVTTNLEFGTRTFNPADFNSATGSNFIAGKGSKTFSLHDRYRGGGGGKQITVTLTAEVIDANNNTVTASINVSVVNAHPPKQL